MQQETAPSLKIIFQVLHKTWYLLPLTFLLNPKLHSTLTIMQCQKDLNFQLLETFPEKILSILKGLIPSKTAALITYPVNF